MAVEIVWSKRADQGYARIVKYLEEEWTEREVQNNATIPDHPLSSGNCVATYQ